MNHDEATEQIGAYVDGELDTTTAREAEQHLRECAACREQEARIRELHKVVAATDTAYRAPAKLKKSISAALHGEDKTTRQSSAGWLLTLAGAACALVVAGLIVWQTQKASESAIADDVVAGHIRSLLATHLVDVPSSDRHTVKPWFNGKVDFAPEVPDLVADDFPLIGGRLDYLNARTVIALVYERGKHPINLFVWPSSQAGGKDPATLSRRGYNVISWRRDGMQYYAVSDLNATELRQFVDRFVARASG